MRYGLHVPLFGDFAEPALVAEVASEAEQAGWDGFFVWDHIAPPWHPVAGDPWITLAAVAVATRHLRIGTLVTALSRRRPWKVARETVALDRLSAGRMTLGAGIGGSAREGFAAEFDDLGEETDPAIRAGMLDEALEVITGLWSGERFSYAGRHYTVRDERFLPVPVQRPRIPTWAAATWPHRAPFRRAARWDGVFPTLHATDDVEALRRLAQALAWIHASRQGADPFDVVCGGETTGVDRPLDAERVGAYAAAGATWWLENITPARWGGWQQWPLSLMRERIHRGPPA